MSNNFKPLTDQVSERLGDQLQQGTSVFQQNSDKPLAMPFNPVSGKSYRGAAALILLMAQKEDPRWLSLKNASFNKTPVLKGEHGTLISFYKTSEMKPALRPDGEKELRENGKPKYESVKLDQAKLETVFMFNAAQLRDMPELTPRHGLSGEERLQQILDHSELELKNEYVIDQLVDLVSGDNRMNLPEVDEDKARLRSQIAGLFIAAELGLPYEMPDYSFVVNTPGILKKEPAELFKAANDAQKIAKLVLSFEKKRELSETLDKGDAIPYKGDTIEVLAIHKGGSAQVRDQEGKKWKIGPTDGIYKSLVEARNNPPQQEKQKNEVSEMAR